MNRLLSSLIVRRNGCLADAEILCETGLAGGKLAEWGMLCPMFV